ncbi:MAG TPA: hypothetical protein PLP35_08530 [Caldisericia bacterium]|nr:hypothetical protein [Caldisericia bacterium]HRV74862.1 hypothetical protein [Caldisericia bacterium]
MKNSFIRLFAVLAIVVGVLLSASCGGDYGMSCVIENTKQASKWRQEKSLPSKESGDIDSTKWGGDFSFDDPTVFGEESESERETQKERDQIKNLDEIADFTGERFEYFYIDGDEDNGSNAQGEKNCVDYISLSWSPDFKPLNGLRLKMNAGEVLYIAFYVRNNTENVIEYYLNHGDPIRLNPKEVMEFQHKIQCTKMDKRFEDYYVGAGYAEIEGEERSWKNACGLLEINVERMDIKEYPVVWRTPHMFLSKGFLFGIEVFDETIIVAEKGHAETPCGSPKLISAYDRSTGEYLWKMGQGTQPDGSWFNIGGFEYDDGKLYLYESYTGRNFIDTVSFSFDQNSKNLRVLDIRSGEELEFNEEEVFSFFLRKQFEESGEKYILMHNNRQRTAPSLVDLEQGKEVCQLRGSVYSYAVLGQNIYTYELDSISSASFDFTDYKTVREEYRQWIIQHSKIRKYSFERGFIQEKKADIVGRFQIFGDKVYFIQSDKALGGECTFREDGEFYNDTSILKINPETLETEWSHELKKVSLSEDSSIDNRRHYQFVDNTVVIISEKDVYGIDSNTGKIVWENNAFVGLLDDTKQLDGNTCVVFHNGTTESESTFMLYVDASTGRIAKIEKLEPKITSEQSERLRVNWYKESSDGYLICEHYWLDPKTHEILGINEGEDPHILSDIGNIVDGYMFYIEQDWNKDEYKRKPQLVCKKIY